MSRFLDPRSDSEQSAYSKAELEAYYNYWDAVSTEKTLLSEREKLGFEKGEKTGFEKGAKKTVIELAKNMLKQGISLSQIQEITGLSEKEIKSL